MGADLLVYVWMVACSVIVIVLACQVVFYRKECARLSEQAAELRRKNNAKDEKINLFATTAMRMFCFGWIMLQYPECRRAYDYYISYIVDTPMNVGVSMEEIKNWRKKANAAYECVAKTIR